MYGEQLIYKLAYGIPPMTSNQSLQDLVLGSWSPHPRGQRAPRDRGVPRNCRILEGLQRTKKNLSRICKKYAV